MASTVLDCFSHIQEDFLSAISNGASAAEEFASKLEKLDKYTSEHWQSALAPDETDLSVLHSAVMNISTIASGLLDVDARAGDLSTELQLDIADIFNTLSLSQASDRVECPNEFTTPLTAGNRAETTLEMEKQLPFSRKNHVENGSGPRTSAVSHSEIGVWLSNNIHNPYPPVAVKKSFVSALGSTMKSVDDWFTNARRKIGWTAFSKRYFRGNRCLTLDCSHRVFVQGEEQGAYCEEIVRDLKNIKATAERLYGSSGSQNTSEPSSFARELESIEAKTSLNNRRGRRLSTNSSSTEQSSTSRSTSSNPVSVSRKRSRTDSEESDATCRSEESDSHSSRPFKRGRSASSASTSPSQESSDSSLSTACSSESNETLCEVVTPAASPPTRSKLPPELFHDWFDGVSAEPGFLPLPNDVDNGRPALRSRKRASPDSDPGSDSHVPSKRARLDAPFPPAAEERGNDKPYRERGPSTVNVATHLGPERASQGDISSTKDPVTLLPTLAPLSEQVFPELDEATVNDILAHLDFSIPQPPILPAPDASPLTGLIEGSLSFFDSSLLLGTGTGTGSSSGLTFADADASDINALLANFSAADTTSSVSGGQVVAQQDVQQVYTGNASETPFLFGDAKPDDVHTGSYSTLALPTFPELPALSFSPLDLAFLENLGSASQTGILSSNPSDSSASLVDVPSSTLPDVEVNCNEKLKRIDQLLAEAQKLQQKVFG